MARYSAFSAEWILPAYEYLKACVLKSKVLHLDETFISCQAEKGSRQYMLVFVSEKGCFYCYTNTRSQTVPFKIMKEQFGDGQWLSDDGDSIVISTDGWYDVEWLKDENAEGRERQVQGEAGWLHGSSPTIFLRYLRRSPEPHRPKKRRIPGFKTCG